jgi:hypothetical protein
MNKQIEHPAEIIEAPEVIPNLNEVNIEALISKAIDKNTAVDIMERLLVIRRELKAEYAKSEFDKDMSEFQSSCPTIKKTKEVRTNTGAIAYKYAPLESIVEQVRGLLKNHGFSYAVQTETKDNMVKATCIVKHKLGHSEASSIEVPLGTRTAIMSSTQQTAAALTFAKRYAFCNSFGILTSDEDTDAQPEPESNTQPKPEAKNGQAPAKPVKIHTGSATAYMRCVSCNAPAGKPHGSSCKAVS